MPPRRFEVTTYKLFSRNSSKTFVAKCILKIQNLSLRLVSPNHKRILQDPGAIDYPPQFDDVCARDGGYFRNPFRSRFSENGN